MTEIKIDSKPIADFLDPETPSDWQPMDTAPKDGMPIQAKIPDFGEAVIGWHGGLLDEYGEECGAWHFMEHRDPPDDWTDGICWDSNDREVPSTKPTEWRPLSAALFDDDEKQA